MDLQEFLSNINRVDLLIFLFFMAFFVLGFAQGTIRRLIGIASILFSFLFAANVAEPLGNYLGSNWTQFSKEYATMIGFMTVFLASSIAFAVVVQGLYKPQPLFQKARFVDELLGGLLGLLEAALIFGCILVILDSFFRIPGHRCGSPGAEVPPPVLGADRSHAIGGDVPRHGDPDVLPVDRLPRAGLDRAELPPLSTFDRSALEGGPVEAARALLGARLVRDDPSGRRAGRIVEVEAYDGPGDRASHARFGLTARNAVMFGPAGRAYVYLVYGMYDCLNVVAGADGAASAVLIRAIEPLEGVERMRADRALVTHGRRRDPRPAASGRRIPDIRIASGPGLVGAAYGLDRSWTGLDLCDPASPLRLEAGRLSATETVADGPRIGIAYAGEPWASVPWRFAIAGHRSVSGARPPR